MFESISVKNLVKILSSFDNSGIVSVQILMKFTSLPVLLVYRYLVSKYARFIKLILHDAPFDKKYCKYGPEYYKI